MSEKESEWYERFKEGVMFLDGWNEISDNILDTFPQEIAAEKELFVRMLGIKIGSEWCRDNEVRQIDTEMLKRWGELIRNAVAQGPESTEKILREIDSEVDRLHGKFRTASLFFRRNLDIRKGLVIEGMPLKTPGQRKRTLLPGSRAELMTKKTREVMDMERTFAIIKPDAFKAGNAGKIPRQNI